MAFRAPVFVHFRSTTFPVSAALSIAKQVNADFKPSSIPVEGVAPLFMLAASSLTSITSPPPCPPLTPADTFLILVLNPISLSSMVPAITSARIVPSVPNMCIRLSGIAELQFV